MGRKNNRKFAGFDPAKRAREEAQVRHDPKQWGTNVEALDLPANADVQPWTDPRDRSKSRQRYDVFHLLYARGALGDDVHKAARNLTSVRLLQSEIAARWGLDAETSEVRGGNGSIELITARKIEAAAKVDALLEWCGRPYANLLFGLFEPLAYGHVPNWRKIVEAAMGEPRKAKQTEHVKLACEALTASYARWDSGERPPKRLQVAA